MIRCASHRAVSEKGGGFKVFDWIVVTVMRISGSHPWSTFARTSLRPSITMYRASPADVPTRRMGPSRVRIHRSEKSRLARPKPSQFQCVLGNFVASHNFVGFHSTRLSSLWTQWNATAPRPDPSGDGCSWLTEMPEGRRSIPGRRDHRSIGALPRGLQPDGIMARSRGNPDRWQERCLP